ncbi:ladderlectin-like [Alosa pseudoharengus]|uniref:ladderlectin-like n=1 Tax=Alosa pseudoharengus TaxID=34774 RepID=UPI003F8930D0
MIIRASFLLLSALVICCRAEATVDKNVTESHVWNSTGKCSWGWFRYGTRCFKFISNTRTWSESERYCVMMGGNLASVHSGEEYHFIQDLVRRHTQDTPRAWIGGCDAAQE